MNYRNQLNPLQQRGSVLIVSLILLMLFTLIGVSAVKQTSLEERMVFNTHDGQVAFQAAESALREAEQWLDTLDDLPHEEVCASTSNCQNVAVISADDDAFDSVDDLRALDESAWQTHATTVTADLDEVNEKPRYLVREVRFIPDSLTVGTGVPPGRYLYEITARGEGVSNKADKVLQSTFIRRY